MSFEKPTNFVEIICILSENELKKGSYEKDGKTVEYLGGSIKVKVTQKIGDSDKVLEIPVHVFTPRLKKDGNANPSYNSWNDVFDMTSIAAAGGEADADAIRVTGSIAMNEYYGKDDKLVSFPQVKGSFVKKARKDEIKQSATFKCEGMVRQKMMEVDKEGNETGRMRVNICVPQWGGVVDEIPFYVSSAKAIDFISDNWNLRDTVPFKGKLNFSSTTETKIIESAFGDPEERNYTISLSELIINGGDFPLEDGAYSMEDVQAGLKKREEKLAAEKAKSANKPKKGATPAKESDMNDMGF